MAFLKLYIHRLLWLFSSFISNDCYGFFQALYPETLKYLVRMHFFFQDEIFLFFASTWIKLINQNIV